MARIKGTNGDDVLIGTIKKDKIRGRDGDDELFGGSGDDALRGGKGDDILEGGTGNDRLYGGRGDDKLYAFSWGGEPVAAQDGTQINAGEPVSDRDVLKGGAGADTFEFRWLIDAKAEILDKHRGADGDVDYSGNGVAGENNNTHDHWVETIGVKIVKDFDAGEGDKLVFEGHTLALASLRHNNGNTILDFVSDQGAGGGAHDGDDLGTVIILDTLLAVDDIQINAGVFYGTEDPWSAAG